MADDTKKVLETGAAIAAGSSPVGAIVSAALPVLGGLFGGNAQSAAAAAAERRAQEIFNMYRNLDVPDIEKMRLSPEMLAYLGDLEARMETPEQLAMVDQLQQIQTDPRLKQTQLNNLEMLEKLSRGGLTAEDKANLNIIRRQTDQDTASRLAGMLQTQDQRGVGTSDAALALRAGAAQAAANRQAEEADREAAMAMQRKMQAISSSSGLAQQLDATDYNRQSELATALRNREMSNFQQKAAAQQRNIDRFNAAQERNLTTQQNLSNANVGTRNEAQGYNKSLYQTDYDNRMKKIGSMSGASANVSNANVAGANVKANQYSSIGQLLGGATSKFMENTGSSDNKKNTK